MRFNFNIFSSVLKEAAHRPENQDLTNILSRSKGFQKFALKLHNTKLKFWQKLDEAAFPENYTNDKMIEQHKKKKNK